MTAKTPPGTGQERPARRNSPADGKAESRPGACARAFAQQHPAASRQRSGQSGPPARRRASGTEAGFYARGQAGDYSGTPSAYRNGGSLALRGPLGRGGLRRVRPGLLYWRCLVSALSGGRPVGQARLNGWLLVLAAKKIPHVFQPVKGNSPRLYVPCLYEGIALHEIQAFERERPLPIFVPPARKNVGGVLLFLLLLAVWHGLRWGWFGLAAPSPPFPALAGDWPGLYGLDATRFRIFHEWWRAITALTLHADDNHLFSNMGFGLLFLIPLCRRAGIGLGMTLAALAGIMGNVLNALTREGQVVSIGFSTAVFGAIGALCALTAADILGHHLRHSGAGGIPFALARRFLAPLAAGLALLGLLGGGGEARTDYAAHIWGFFSGVAVTLAALPLERTIFRLPPDRQIPVQAALLIGVLVVLIGAWVVAL